MSNKRMQYTAQFMDKKGLKRIYYEKTPKARDINPFFRASFELLWDCRTYLGEGKSIFNVYSSNDLSSAREEFMRDIFFAGHNYISADFWEDKFVYERRNPEAEFAGNYSIELNDCEVDVILTTKVILEHVSNPEKLLQEFNRILKPGGRAYLIVPHIRRQHQKPHDYFRYTEFGISHLANKTGFKVIDCKNTGGFMATVGYYAYFFQRGLNMPRWLERCLDWFIYTIVEPALYFLDGLDNGYGRDMTLYFMVTLENEGGALK